MGLRDRFQTNTTATTATEPASAPAAQASSASSTPSAEPTLAEMRAKLAAGKTGGVNPPEAKDAPLSVEPKTGPNGESLTDGASSGPDTAPPAASTTTDAPVEPAKVPRGRKASVKLQDSASETSPFGSFLALVEQLQAALPAGVTITITRVS